MKECISSMVLLYETSNIPVVIFTDKMEIVWTNNSFNEYFPGVELIGQNISAISGTAIRSALAKSKGYSERFQLIFKSEKKVSSSIVLLVFPLEKSDSFPKNFIGYADDLTKERNMILRKTYIGLLEASKLKDDDTGNHIKRVGAYAKRLSEECFRIEKYPQINPDFIENIHFLAPMHDVGKIGTPDEILTKRGPLNESEWAIMRQHTVNGALILSNYPETMASEIARNHHEKWDGSGYLYGLAGEDIPLSARITTIADVYDALRMKRSYKEAFSHEKSVDIIKSESGTHFDPDLIEIFLSIEYAFNDIYNALSDDMKLENESLEDLPAYIEEIDVIEELEEL